MVLKLILKGSKFSPVTRPWSLFCFVCECDEEEEPETRETTLLYDLISPLLHWSHISRLFTALLQKFPILFVYVSHLVFTF